MILNPRFDEYFLNWLEELVANERYLIYSECVSNIKNYNNPQRLNFEKLLDLHDVLVNEIKLETNTQSDNIPTIFKYKNGYYRMFYEYRDEVYFTIEYLCEKPSFYINLNIHPESFRNHRGLYILINKDKIESENITIARISSINDAIELTTKCALEYTLNNQENKEVKAWLKNDKTIVLLSGSSEDVYLWHCNHGGFKFSDKNYDDECVIIGIVDKNTAQPLLKHFKKIN